MSITLYMSVKKLKVIRLSSVVHKLIVTKVPNQQCCSILPKDLRIHRDELVRIWMALRYLSPKGSRYQMEDVGNEYFNILLWNTLLQDVQGDEFNNIISCQVHDLVHDLAVDLPKNESATVKASRKLISTPKVKHLRMEYSVEEIQPKFEKKYIGRVETLYADYRIRGDMLPNLKDLEFWL